MRYIILTTLLIIFILAQPAYSYKTKAMTKKNYITNAELKQKLQEIEIIDGKPNKRKYKTLGPVMGKCEWSTTMNCALKKMKKEAIKMGADAVIKVKMDMSKQSSAGAAGGFFAYGSSDHAVVSGWAVKWLN